MENKDVIEIPVYYKDMLKEALELYKEKHRGPWEKQNNGSYAYATTNQTKRADWLIRNVLEPNKWYYKDGVYYNKNFKTKIYYRDSQIIVNDKVLNNYPDAITYAESLG